MRKTSFHIYFAIPAKEKVMLHHWSACHEMFSTYFINSSDIHWTRIFFRMRDDERQLRRLGGKRARPAA
jgi:hypothetical protein